MAVIDVRIDDDLKKKMDKYKYINWGEIIRTEIKKIVEKLESRNLAEAPLLNEIQRTQGS